MLIDIYDSVLVLIGFEKLKINRQGNTAKLSLKSFFTK
jgi:hypothetical protein